jgi:hypothetical protein
LTVPEGAVVPAAALDALRANREQLVAALAPASPPAPAVDDLRDYLGTKGVAGPAADLVEHAVDVFGIRHDRITVEQDGAGEPEPTFFDPGIPCRTTADTLWHESGHGYRELPAGTFALAIPQTWAIDDPFQRLGIEGAIESAKRRGQPLHVPIWMEGQARVIEADLLTFDNVVAPDGTNLVPWRPTTPRSALP